MPLRRVFWQALVALLCLMFSTSLLAQSTGGRILGRVTDPAAAVVSGAKVTLTNEATGISRTVETDSSGNYTLVQVPVGKYTITIEHADFKQNVHKGVTLELNQVLTVDAVLQVGARTEVVEVTGEAPLVDTNSTQLGAVVGSRAVAGLPLNARDTYQLLQLQPGVQSQVGSDLFYGSDRAGVVSVNGGRGRSNNFSVNGGEANDLFVNLPAIQPSPDSIQEFRVLTNTMDAEYGRNSGAVVNVVTKSGTNQWHGSLFEFFRNKVLNARGFFDVEKPDLKQNQFGGTLGGPIVKDRTFLFVSYEGRRLRQGRSGDLITVPTTAERGGDFSATPFDPTPADGIQISNQTVANVLNNRPGCAAAITGLGGAAPAAGELWANIFPTSVVPTECMDPVALDLLDQFVPPANVGGSLFQSVPVARHRGDQFTIRLDHRINDHHNFNFYYYFTDEDIFEPFARFQAGGANVPGFGALSNQRIQQINASEVWTINPTMVNEFRFSYFREAQGTFLHPQRTDLVTNSCVTATTFCFTGTSDAGTFNDDNGNPIMADPKHGITPVLGAGREGVPFITVSGGFNIGNNFEGELPQVGNTFQWSDNITKVLHNHTLKFGGDVRRQHFDQTLYFDVNGEFFYFGGGPNDTGNLFANYLLGLPDLYGQGSAQHEFVRFTSLYLFAQDSWKMKPNLTLNYGLRWELNTPITDIGKRVQTFRPGQATAIYPCQISAASGLFPAGTDCNPGGAAESVFPLGLVVPGDRGVPPGMTQTYYKAFAPRIGLAWSPGAKEGWVAKLTGGPDKTSIRMGWGMFYNPIEQLVLEQFSAEPPFGGSTFVANTLFNTPFIGQDGTVIPNPFNGILDPPRGQPVDWSLFRPILLFGQFQPHMRSQYSVQYHFTIQRELAKDLVLQMGYVGSQGHRLLATHDLNFSSPQTCLDLQALFDSGNPAYTAAGNGISDTSCGPFFSESAYGFVLQPGDRLTLPSGSVVTGGAGGTPIALVGLRRYSSPLCDPLNGYDPGTQSFINGCPPDGVPVFSSIFAQDTIANSNYNSLQVSVEKRFSHGLQFQAAYTWSKSIDQASSFEGILNPIDPRRSRGLSQFDARHRFVFSYYWELPVPKYEGAKGKLLNGWALSGITTFQSGFPIRITSADDLELMNSFDFELPGEPDQVARFRRLDPRTSGGYFFDPSAFTPQALGTIGNAPRTICCGPGVNNFDIAFHKSTPIDESKRIEFRAEFFNVWNHTQFLNPDGNITDGSDFGRVKRVRDPRFIQFALKFLF